MKTRLLFALTVIAVSFYSIAFFSSSEKDSINPIIGNASYWSVFGHSPQNETCDSTRISTHLRYAHHLLLENTENLADSEIKNKRFVLLNLLDEYIQRGLFPINSAKEERTPCFIDEFGTICAVGYLVEQTAGLALAEHINKNHQYDFIEDMNITELDQWIAQSGFSKREMAMIQPTYANFIKITRTRSYFGVGLNTVSRDLSFGNFQFQYGRSSKSYLFSGGLNYHSLGKKDFNLGAPILFSHGALRYIVIGAEPEYYLNEGQRGLAFRPSISFQKSFYEKHIKTSFGIEINLGHSFAHSEDHRDLPPTSLRLSLLITPHFRQFF